jgi:1-pyrroline-5-carboxylate dehydrogenase
MDAVTNVPFPVNEPVLTYAPGNPERAEVEAKLGELASQHHELTCTIGGDQKLGGGNEINVVQPHKTSPSRRRGRPRRAGVHSRSTTGRRSS